MMNPIWMMARCSAKSTCPQKYNKMKGHLSLAIRRISLTMWGISLCIVSSSCAGLSQSLFPRQTEPPVYRPPTASAATALPVISASPVSNAVSTASPPAITPTPACSNDLTYIEDLTIPDGTAVQPQEMLDKSWLVENSGTCNWDGRYRLRLIAGPSMNTPTEQALFPARSNTQTSIRIVFSAPDAAGEYRSAWQAYDPNGQVFGDPIFIDIVVAPITNNP